MGKPGFGGGFEQDHQIPLNPVLWASSAQNSHLLALLRATQNPNPNPNPSQLSNLFGSHLTSGSDSMGATEALSSYWRNNQNQAQQPHQNHHYHQQVGVVLGEVQNSGIHDFYQRLRATANYYPHEHQPVPLLSTTSSSSSTAVLESAPVSAAAEMAYWNPTLTWSDLQTTTNGAYP